MEHTYCFNMQKVCVLLCRRASFAKWLPESSICLKVSQFSLKTGCILPWKCVDEWGDRYAIWTVHPSTPDFGSLPEKDLHITGHPSGPVMLNVLLDHASCNWTGLTFTGKNHTGHSVQWHGVIYWTGEIFLLDNAFGPVLFGKTALVWLENNTIELTYPIWFNDM